MSDPPGATGPSLREHPFVLGLDPGLLGILEDAAELRRFEAGELLAREGVPSHEFFLIRSGKVALELGGPGRPHLTLQTVGPGELLGWSWILPPHTWRFDARAIRATEAWQVDAGRVRDGLDDLPTEGYAFLLRLLAVLATRLEHTRLQLGDLYAP